MSRVMKKRSAVKDNGFRLVDDVTKAKVSLIKRLSEHKVSNVPGILMVWSTWKFKVGDKRMKLDITDNFENKVEKKAAR